MKKLISLLLVLTMVAAMAVGCASTPAATDAPTDAPTEAPTEPPVVLPASSLEVMEKIWAQYGDDEKFPVMGGNIEDVVDGAPGNYNMTYAENLPFNLLVPADQLANVTEAATMIHMMNANTFTGGVVKLADGVDAAAFATTMRDAIQNNQWMCGFPEKLVVATIGDTYVVIAFGVNDAMNPFQAKLTAVYPEAVIAYDEAVNA